jgi:hypothetical protein
MARLAVGVVGAAVGFYLGGPAGASIGWSLGAAAGGFLFPEQGPNVEGARLDDLRVMGSSYGVPIPIVYGAMRVPGQVIWAANLREVRTEEDVGGKGGPSATQVSYSYTGTFAVALCEGQIAAVTRIWANGQCIYDVRNPANTEALVASGNWVAVSGMRVYLGTEAQLPDPAIEAAQGVGTTPAFRGLAYVVFENLPLSNYGNALPRQLDFEVVTGATPAAPLQRLSITTGITPAWQGAESTAFLAMPIVNWVEGVVGVDTQDGSSARIFTPAGAYAGPTSTSLELRAARGLPPYIGSGAAQWCGCGFDAAGVALYALLTTGGTPSATTSWDLRQIDAAGPSLRASVGAPGNSHLAHVVLSRSRRELLVVYRDLDAGSVYKYTLLALVPALAVIDAGTCAADVGAIPAALCSTAAWNYTIDLGGRTAVALEDNLEWLWFAYDQSGPKRLQVLLFQRTAGVLSLVSAVDDAYTGDLGLPGIDVEGGMAAVARKGDISLYTRTRPATVAAPTLQTVVSGLCTRAGLTAGQIDVTALSGTVDGVAYTRGGSGRSMLDSLRAAYWFDAVESGDKIRFVPRGGAPVAALTLDDLAAADDGAAITSEREHDDALPERVAVAYAARDSDYRVGSQMAVRSSLTADALRTIELPLALSDQRAADAAAVALADAWMGRTARRLTLMPKWAALEPTDVIDLTDATRSARLRIVRKSESLASGVQLEVVDEEAALYTPAATAGAVAATGNSPALGGPTLAVPLDLPPLRDQDDDPGLYAAVAGYLAAWPGGALYRSADGGATWAQAAAASRGAVVGNAEVALPAFAGGQMIDEASVLDVAVPASATLASCTRDQLFAGANAAALGAEIIGFRDAALLSAGRYRLTGLLRGRQGTPQTGHAVGERFVLLTTALVDVPGSLSDIGRELRFAGVTVGTALTDSTAQAALTFAANRVRPLAPVHLSAGRLGGSSDIVFAWRRQARINTAWRDAVDTPLDEPSEAYELEVVDGGTLVRTVTGVTSPTWTYSRAQQEADFGIPPAALTLRAFQMSSRIGRGSAGEAGFVFPRAVLYSRDWADLATTPLTLTVPSGASGSHTAASGNYQITGGNTWTVQAAFGSPAPTSVADVDLEVDVVVPATAGHVAGVIVRGGTFTAVNWGAPGYLFDISGLAGGAGVVARIGKVAAGARSDLASGTLDVPVTLGATVVRLRVVAKGSALRLYLDGTLVCSFGGDTTYTTGVLGFLTISAQAQTFDNLVLYQAV